MPQLRGACPKGQGGTGQRRSEARVCACKWMEQVKQDREEAPAKRSRDLQRSNQTPADVLPHKAPWPHFLKPTHPWKGWFSVAPVCVLWSVCQTDVLLNPSSFALDVCGRLLLVYLLWMVAQTLKYKLKQRSYQSTQQEAAAENRVNQYSESSPSGGPGQRLPLALAVADCLLVCVLQEPLSDPSVPHIRALLCRLESVSHTLDKAGTGSEATPNGPDRDSPLADKVKIIHTYLQQRTGLLRALIQVQRDFEASVKDMLGGLDGLWSQLEDLHTGVTLTKEAGRGRRDLALAQTDAKTLFSVLGYYSNKLQLCQENLKRGTELLQEIIWSHTHISNRVNGSVELMWPELLLQSNIEQFDKTQESFLSLEQQTRTFQAHLEGLGRGIQEAHAGPLAYITEAHSCSSSRLHGSARGSWKERHHLTSTSGSVEAETLSFWERSALPFASTIKHLRKPGKKK